MIPFRSIRSRVEGPVDEFRGNLMPFSQGDEQVGHGTSPGFGSHPMEHGLGGFFRCLLRGETSPVVIPALQIASGVLQI